MAEASEKFAKILPVSGTPTLIVRHNAGTLRLIVGSSDHIAVEAMKTATAWDGEEARRALETMEILVTQSENTVRVETKHHQHSSFFFGGFGGQRRIDLMLTVPADLALDLNLNAGTAELVGIGGALDLELNAGSTKLREVTFAGRSRLRVNAGSVTGEAALRPETELDISLNSGNLELTLPADTPAHVDAAMNAGAIHFAGWNIPVQQRFVQASASGDLAPNPTAHIIVRANAGRVAFRQRAKAGAGMV